MFFRLLSVADDRKSLIFLSVFFTTVGFMAVSPSQASDTLYKSHHWFSMNPVDQPGPYKGKAAVHYQGAASTHTDEKNNPEESRAELGTFGCR